MDDNELYHYGVLGMKWGVRKARPSSGNGKKRKKKKKGKELSPDAKARNKRKDDLRNRRTMSDDELRKKIERLKLEKEFRELTKDDIGPGKKFASEVMSSAGKKVLTAAAAGAMAYAVKVAMTKEFDAAEAAGYIATNPNKKK